MMDATSEHYQEIARVVNTEAVVVLVSVAGAEELLIKVLADKTQQTDQDTKELELMLKGERS